MLKLASFLILGCVMGYVCGHGDMSPLEKYVSMRMTESCFGKPAVHDVWGKTIAASVKCQQSEPHLPEFKAGQESSPAFDLPVSVAKAVQIRDRVIAQTGNITCILRELNLITESFELNLDDMKAKLQGLEISDGFKADLLDGLDTCVDFANGVANKGKSQAFRHLMKPMGFFRCFNTKKIMACAKNDINERFAAGAPRDTFDNLDSDDSNETYGVKLFSIVYGLDVNSADKMFAVL